MNRAVTKCPAADSESGFKTFRKLRRKRRKCKSKTKPKSRRKNQKNYVKVTEIRSVNSYKNKHFKIKKPKDNFSKSYHNLTMSNWYWSNYHKAFEWSNKHKVAKWKACALALQHENKYLLDVIRGLNPEQKIPGVPVTLQDLDKNDEKFSGVNCRPATKSDSSDLDDYEGGDNETEDGNNEEFAFEMSEEMLEYFEKSIRHKMDLKKARDEEEARTHDNKVNEAQINRIQKAEEMKLLYGDGASMIIGMETAMQLSYDRYCDLKSPKFWPNIPLRL